MNEHTAALLGQHFDTAFAAPNGVKRLRELILTLAMQGKLVEQDPSDPPASELLKAIEAEKSRRWRDGKIKSPKPLPAINSSEVPYELPKGWQWVRLGTIGNIFNGNSINSSEKDAKFRGVEGMPYIATKDVGYGLDPLDYENGVFIPPSHQQFRVARKGAVLLCAEGGSAGKKCGITERDICFGNKLFANELFGSIPSRFMLYVYLSTVFRSAFEAAMTGIIGGVSIAKFVELPIPLPPLNQQHRIVAKIDQLMTRCDELENLRSVQNEKRLAVHAAAIKKLSDANADGDFADAWQFVVRHFSELYSVKENVAELRKTVLELAVRGHLSELAPSDEPINVLLYRLQKEQEENQLIGKKDREEIRQRLSRTIREADGGQVNLAARDFCEFITKGTTPAADELTSSGDVPFLKVYNIVNNKIDFDYKPTYISSSVHRGQLKRSIVRPGDVIMNIVGPPLGKVAVVNDQFPEWNINQALAVFRPLAGILSQYIYYALSTSSVLSSTLREVKGTAGQDNLSLEQCRDLVIRIPSLDEQHRIVRRVCNLMILCDRLEEQIDAANDKQTELLNAVMAQM